MTELAEPVHGLERGTVRVDGVDVAWERWPRPGAIRLVLVHGTSAHTAWWHHTVPYLADRYDVTAVDLSGHGESGRRPAYSLAAWSAELAAVAASEPGPVVLVGHSIGGLVVAGAAPLVPAADLAGAVLVDCIVQKPRGAGAVRPVLRIGAVYPTAAEALARYRLMPPQPVPDDRTLTYVAEQSLRAVEGGWSWKVDPHIFGALDADLTAPLAGLACPVALVRGELSQLVEPDAGDVLGRLLGRPVPQYDVPDAYHHVMIDQGPVFGRILRRALDQMTVPPDAP
jgi:pimeloyl-ACP methyl ester carboxylesterase